MDVLLFFSIVIVVILLITQKNELTSRMAHLQARLDEVTNELRRLNNKTIVQSEPTEQDVKQSAFATTIKPAPKIEEPPRIDIPEERKPEPLIEKTKTPEPVVPPVVNVEPPLVEKPKVPIAQPLKTEAPAEPFVLPKKPGFFERNPDLEKFVGENLANKIGIAILVLGIGFFVKYAIDQDWINEIGRVFIGVLCGGILLGVAHWLRKSFTAFSSVLVGGGIAVLYVTIAIAFHEYGLMSQSAAFIVMVLITAFTILLSLSYNRVELAILAILGGFASPFMVSTGEGNYVVLFTYVLILDIGMVVLAYYKRWNLVNIVSYVFTLILFGSWLSLRFDETNGLMVRGALMFATLFYFVFFFMNIINNVKNRTSFKALEISLLLSNTFLYYAAGMYILNNPSTHNLQGLFTALVGIFNFVFAFTLYRNSHADNNLVFLLIGLVLTFITLAAPVQLEGNYITLFWAAESVLLLWLSQQSGIRLMKLASVVIQVLMVISLIIDWDQLYNPMDTTTVLPLLLNKAYITSIFSIACLVATFVLLRREKGDFEMYVPTYRMVLTVGIALLLYTSQLLELQYQLTAYIDHVATRTVLIGTYNMFFLLLLLFAEKKLTLPDDIRTAFAGWGVLAIMSYFIFYHQAIIDVRNDYLAGITGVGGFLSHYLFLTLLIIVVSLSLIRIRQYTEFNKNTHNVYSWFFVFFFVFVASAELDHSVLLTVNPAADRIHDVLRQNHKIGYPILWGLASFLLVVIGFRNKIKHLRIIALTLFLLTLLKLFIVDIKGISEGGKIAAFISLGLLLLIVSFMYQRLKKLLLDEPVPADKQNKSHE